ncbi:MAG: amidohydrolase family protein [Chromatiales bacterium]|jgi:imidazolonepropionase-like amidohydrolase|nr:amidohydrolase family protein [Chromatiales bacterium]
MSDPQIIIAPHLYDGVGDSISHDMYVEVTDGNVTAVGPRQTLSADLSHLATPPVELPDDTTLLPGLINMHTHLSFSALPTVFADALAESDATKMIRIVQNMRAALEVGITTVRDCGTWPHLALPARDAVASGMIAGPRLITSGAITTTGGHCWFCATEADSEDEVRKAVRAHVKDGVDFIKLFATGGNTTPGSNALTTQYRHHELCAATEEARKAGRRTAAHAHAIDGVRNAIAARVTTIEHCSFQTDDGYGWNDAMVDEIIDAGIVVCPTVFRGPAKFVGIEGHTPSDRETRFAAKLETRYALTRRLAERGVTLVSGNDAGVANCQVTDFPGDLVATADHCGMTPAHVIRTATSVAAQTLGRTDLGAIAAGKVADLLVVRGNPLADIRALERTHTVMAAGRIVHTATA